MNAPINIYNPQLTLAVATAIAEAPFNELERQSAELALMAACGSLSKQDAVDIAYSAARKAIGAGTWYWFDVDVIQEIIASGFELPEAGPYRPKPQPYRTPQSTIDAFWYVVSLCDPERLNAWLDDHPQDAPFLLKLLEGK